MESYCKNFAASVVVNSCHCGYDYDNTPVSHDSETNFFTGTGRTSGPESLDFMRFFHRGLLDIGRVTV